MTIRHLFVFFWVTSFPMAQSTVSLLACITLPPIAFVVWIQTVLQAVVKMLT